MRTFVSHASLSVGRATPGRSGVLRGTRLRDRRHLDAGAGHRRRRPRPRAPDRLAIEPCRRSCSGWAVPAGVPARAGTARS
ncbi:MAG: hypothetical protein MZW92_66040 [Comamonadaceae bacterium]|nr:hypothetical protein [Comamonadaceae bacterium]